MQSQNQQQNMQSNTNQNNLSSNLRNVSDEILCNDLLMTEKYVSGAYDTALFEFANTNIRQVLNHIQKEEQKHGEDIFNYISSHGMYMPE
ncbi:spore coat protein [Serpentinicella alkaliphila]|uniref:Coat F domain-containing protein n=1 Tax=Serpentinicella alkaliphila TaxID=1734049 RepID=A0A4R2T5M0_9FIRM|nr:spore coat protein [Serpentinicella alkaliphila]TCP98379.1 coat F domain-containing protein [Serpentinicella alkaliphila]